MKCKIGIWSVFAFIRPLSSSSSRGRGEDRRMYANFELCTVWMRSTTFNTQYWTARDSTLNSEAMLFMKLKLKPIQFTAYWIIAITGKMREFSIHLHIAEATAATTTTTTTKDGKQKDPIFLLIHLFIWHTKKSCRQYLCQRPSSILRYDWRCYLQLSNLKDIDTLHFFHNIISFCTSFTKQMDLTIDGNYEMDQHNLRWGMLKSENWSCIDCTLETCTKLSFSHYSNCFCKSFAEVTEKIADIIKIHLVFVLALATISSWQSA